MSKEVIVGLTALIFFVGMETYNFFMYNQGITELINALGYGGDSNSSKAERSSDGKWYVIENNGKVTYIFD